MPLRPKKSGYHPPEVKAALQQDAQRMLDNGVFYPEVAERLGIDERTLYRWIKSGKVKKATEAPAVSPDSDPDNDPELYYTSEANIRQNHLKRMTQPTDFNPSTPLPATLPLGPSGVKLRVTPPDSGGDSPPARNPNKTVLAMPALLSLELDSLSTTGGFRGEVLTYYKSIFGSLRRKMDRFAGLEPKDQKMTLEVTEILIKRIESYEGLDTQGDKEEELEAANQLKITQSRLRSQWKKVNDVA